MKTPETWSFAENLRICRYGVLLALITILFGFGLGGIAGGLEGSIKGGLAAAAEPVRDSVYGGDEAKMKSVLDKSWSYYKRAHMHGGGIGNTVLVLILLVAALRRPTPAVRRGLTLGLGIGALGYSSYWLLAGRRAPAMGGTDLAKASLEWLAFPSAALLLLGVVAVILLVGIELFAPARHRP